MLPQKLDSERETALSLLSAAAVRERAHEMLEIGLDGNLPYCRIDMGRMPYVADYVANFVRSRYPDLRVPLHARWRHFVFGTRDLWTESASRFEWSGPQGRARAEFDLATVSVLLDAGAGLHWRYRDHATGLTVGRSEGLALASLRMFEAGLFSADPRDPLRADASRLAQLEVEDLARGFQCSSDNPLTGLDGRAALLARLGRTLLDNPKIFAGAETARPGGLFDYLAGGADGIVPAPDILRALLLHLCPIWQCRPSLAGIPLGDTWRHSSIRRGDATNSLVPLHKLAQWLSYSLIAPLRRAGLAVPDFDGLTGLAEYRNGGLFIDCGMIVLRHAVDQERPLPVDHEAVIEWRALTVALLDCLLPQVRERLAVAAESFPLAAMLEGGTWAAGRAIAKDKRPPGAPPLTVISDGTVF